MFCQELPVRVSCWQKPVQRSSQDTTDITPKAQALNLGNDTCELRTAVTPRGKALERLTQFPHTGASKNRDCSSGKLPQQSVQNSKAPNPYGPSQVQANCPEHGKLWHQVSPLSPCRKEKFLHTNLFPTILSLLELYLMQSTQTNIFPCVKIF